MPVLFFQRRLLSFICWGDGRREEDAPTCPPQRRAVAAELAVCEAAPPSAYRPRRIPSTPAGVLLSNSNLFRADCSQRSIVWTYERTGMSKSIFFRTTQRAVEVTIYETGFDAKRLSTWEKGDNAECVVNQPFPSTSDWRFSPGPGWRRSEYAVFSRPAVRGATPEGSPPAGRVNPRPRSTGPPRAEENRSTWVGLGKRPSREMHVFRAKCYFREEKR